MRFPTRRDYLDFLVENNVVADEKGFIDRLDLNEEVYLDWLRRGQVGCIFAQLLGRTSNRSQMRTAVFGDQDPETLARKIAAETIDAMADPAVEGLSILLTTIVDSESLVKLLASLSTLPRWRVPRQSLWGKTLIQLGVEFQIERNRWAEVLGLGPFPTFLPLTRQGPITSLEIRTKPKRARKSKTVRDTIAAHLAEMPTDHYLDPKKHGVLFAKMTPALRRRILGDEGDQRGRARVTFSVPAALWKMFKPPRR